MRVVIDCANGAAYKVAPEALWELGAEVIKIGVEPNGVNINLDVGSTSPEALSRKVREMRADIGIALDGDADRMIVVDEKGHVIDGDQILAVIAESWMADGRLSKPSDRRDRHVESRPRAASGRASGCASSAPRSATAMCSSAWSRKASMSAANNPAT